MSEMNPEQPQPMSMSQPSEGGVPSGPFKGDRIYAIGDFLSQIVGSGITFSLIPALKDEALKKMAESPNGAQKVDPDMIGTFLMGYIGCVGIFSLIISIFLWINMIKGKKWAFIVSIVLMVLFIGMGAMGLSGAGAMGAVFGIGVGLVKLVYCIMRMIGKVGPELK